jgi:dTDP-4-amino-4,6-dideoxy-D-galactose acyltransferase
MDNDSLCQYLEWDSRFFDRRIARVTLDRLCHQDVPRIIQWCDSHRIQCLYFLADPSDPETIRSAEDNAFRLVDIRVTLERDLANISPLNPEPSECIVRDAASADVPTLRSIARASRPPSRFYYDGNFPQSSADSLYETWIEKSCHGYADAVLVCELAGRVVGFISLHLSDLDLGHIGLVGVTPDAKGKGPSSKLLAESFRWFNEHHVRRVRVVTQGRNVAAQRLFQKHGLLTANVQMWYHRWFGEKPAR